MRISRTYVLPIVLSCIAVLAANQPPPAGVLHVAGRTDSTPWVAAVGDLVVAAWGAKADGRADVFAAVSQDGGRTFAAPVQVNIVAGEARLGGEFPPRVAIVPTEGRAPEVVVLWTAKESATEVKLSRSTDGGRHFGSPVVLQAAGAAGDRGWPALAVDGRGTAHAVWLDHRALTRAAPGASGMHDHSSEASSTRRSVLFHASAGVAGQSDERAVAAGVCYCCKTALTVAPDGTLYAAWRHVYPGNVRDIAMSVSRDAGRTFSAPVRISEDGWTINGCPDDGPALAVDGSGTVHVVWPTVVGGASPKGALFYATTKDGRHFTPRARVLTLGGPKPTHPQIVVGHGRVFVAWDESLDGRRVAAVREVVVRAGKPSFGAVVEIAPGPAHYPVLAAVRNGLVAVWSTGGESPQVLTRILQPAAEAARRGEALAAGAPDTAR